MSFLDNMKNETTVGMTQNGAKTFNSSLNYNVDLFGQAGAMRHRVDDAVSMFVQAYSEDKEMALRNLVYLRDVRGGLGERDLFRAMVRKLIDEDPEVAKELLPYVSFLGRWDDLVDAYAYAKDSNNKVIANVAVKIIGSQLNEDLDKMKNGEQVSLAGKWLPSPSVKNKERKRQANMLANDLGISVRNFRKTLSALRKYIGIVETKLSEKDYESIDFEKLPSRALFKYRQAFSRNMEEEYAEFINRVNKGEIKANASNVLPYEIIRNYSGDWDYYSDGLSVKDYDAVLEATWKSLDDTIGDSDENAIVVADTSGSMFGDPWFVAESLAIYAGERLNGAFKNHFITFSTQPSLIELPENGTLKSKMEEYSRHSIISNTDIEAVFKLILDVAVKNNTKQEDLPSKIIIVSDMEFDYMTRNSGTTAFENAKMMFEEKGYQLPSVVFWNVNAYQTNLPVRYNEQGVALVAGLTPNIFKQVLLSKELEPASFMREVLMNERYDFVVENVLKKDEDLFDFWDEL